MIIWTKNIQNIFEKDKSGRHTLQILTVSIELQPLIQCNIYTYVYRGMGRGRVQKCSHVLHKNVFINDGPNISLWSHKIIIELNFL